MLGGMIIKGLSWLEFGNKKIAAETNNQLSRYTLSTFIPHAMLNRNYNILFKIDGMAVCSVCIVDVCC